MSINNELPKELERAIRELNNDDIFLDQVWGKALVFYHDFREMEIHAISKDQAISKARRTLAALSNLRQAVNLADYFSPPNRWMQTLNEMEKHYSEHLTNFENLPRKQNWVLQGMAENLFRIFECYNVPILKIASFMKFAIPFIEPTNDRKEKKNNPPSASAIEKAVSRAKKNIN